jgi:tripartite-type tricarboxylate transporter receptor subunit TctC
VQVQFVFNASQVISAAKTGKLRALAVASRQRLSTVPELATMHEAGLKGFEAIVWNGILAPTGTPREVVTRIHAQTSQSMKELTRPLADMGAYPMFSTPEQFAAYIRTEIVKWAAVVKKSGARAE